MDRIRRIVEQGKASLPRPALKLVFLGALAIVAIFALGPGSAAGRTLTKLSPRAWPSPKAASTLDDPNTCPDGNACTWEQTNYDGQRDVFSGAYAGIDWQFYDYNRHSAKSRFGQQRKMKLIQYDPASGLGYIIACLDSGESRADPGWFNMIHISEITSDKCG